MIVSFGLPLMFQNALFNTVCLVADGKILGFVAKQHLAGDGIHYEPRWFKPWPAGVRQIIDISGTQYPLGDIFFQCGDVRIGFEICEDAWVAMRPGAQLALHGVDIILNPSASHFAFGKIRIRERFVLEGTRAFNTTYVYSNLLGNEAGRAIYDGGALIASGDRLVARGPRFSYHDVVVTAAVVDIDATRMNQARSASFRPHISNDGADPVRTSFDWPQLESFDTTRVAPARWEASPNFKEEEFTRAVTLALFDYLRKSHSQGFVVSLSGGADSAAVSCLVALMACFAARELGLEGAVRKLGIRVSPDTEAELIAEILTCVYQASRNSSDTTLNAARQLAATIHSTFFEFDIAPLVDGYTRDGRDRSGSKTGLENRRPCPAKHPGPCPLARRLDGRQHQERPAALDQQPLGGRRRLRNDGRRHQRRPEPDRRHRQSFPAPLARLVGKRWAGRFRKYSGPQGHQRPGPTAELRPHASKQTDEDDLMPYPVLDAIEKAAIRDKLSPIEVHRRLSPEFPQYAHDQFTAWIDRFFKLWCRNQWKRERYAPSFHLDDENLDPKTWCRFPILSGGFEKELANLKLLAEKS